MKLLTSVGGTSARILATSASSVGMLQAERNVCAHLGRLSCTSVVHSSFAVQTKSHFDEDATPVQHS